ncbi:hypothetical protein AK830_g11802 [Neonectria ditissima]|uniref:Transcription factor domain-containing protein n=1 Tax=Neonectria ditissima TaxID=78410 RepID=A0A0N8H4Z8_9HYPO|nr:hypothetical protein AK830_g11802 [Neonectria ditissima]
MSALLTELWIWYALTVLVVMARMVSRRLLYGSISGTRIDDYIMLFTIVTYTVLLVVVKVLTYTPTNLIDPNGKHVTLDEEAVKDRVYGSKLVIVTEQMQMITIWSVKACLLIMYSRLTTSLRQNYLVKIVSGYTALSFVLMEILFFAAWYRPFQNYWKVPSEDINCSAETNHMITNAVLNISTDLMIIALPMPVFLQSQLPIKRKVVLVAVFALGAFSILAAALSKYYSLGDPYGTEWIYWYIREVSTAIITANLPFTWTLLQRMFRIGSFHAKYGKSSGQRTGDAPTRLRSAYGNLGSRTREERRTRLGTVHDPDDLSPSESQEQINAGYSIPLKIYQKNEVHVTSEEVGSKDGRIDAKHGLSTIASLISVFPKIVPGHSKLAYFFDFKIPEESQDMALKSLPYHEPGIVTILIQASFLLLLNVVNFILDNSLYCGLLGQVFLGVAWGTPGVKWLGTEAEEVIVQLGYLGLLLLVYEGGLATSLQALKANLLLSLGVAITGIGLPMALSFLLRYLTDATPLQCFAVGAALCSTSLGTTFTVLGTSGLTKSRLGVVLTSAAMMDDVVGLVMVQIISNLGGSDTSISAVTVLRPLLVSVAFAVFAPLVCVFIAKPITKWLNAKRAKRPSGYLERGLGRGETVFLIHTLILLGCITASSYAGTSNLFAAYIAGTSISWWDSDVPHPVKDTVSVSPPRQQVGGDAAKDPAANDGNTTALARTPTTTPCFSGVEIYDKYYLEPVNRILRPLFFASIGFSIPITEMFSGPVVWRGLVYTLLMAVGKLVCGAWLLRLSFASNISTKLWSGIAKVPKPGMGHFWGKSDKPDAAHSNAEATKTSPTTKREEKKSHTEPAGQKPRSIYPASILGCAMIARGEIGFLISSIAESKRVFSSGSDSTASSEIFLIVTWAIVLCTILGPLAVGLLVRRVKKLEQGVERKGRMARSDVLGTSGSDIANDHAAVSFLAPQVFVDAGLELPRLDVPVPDSVRDMIGGTSDIRHIAIAFFESIHSWMPIISKRRFHTHLLNPLSCRQTELSLLAICMKLYCSPPPEYSDGRTELYMIAKQFHFEVETAGLLSIHVLQAGIVIALYEIGQAVYPAAHLSVSACARYAAALGIDKLGLNLMGYGNRSRSWTEIEEMRRVWWAVLMLDRFLNLSNPSRHLATEDPTIDFYLPVDTESWDADLSTPEDAVNMSTGFTLEMGLFSRLAQATYLLSQAIKSVTSPTRDADLLEERAQLRRTLLALINVADTESQARGIEFCSHLAVCFSETPSFVSIESASALETLSRLACSFFTEGLGDPVVMNSVSVFLIQATYQAASALIRISDGNPDSKMMEGIEAIKQHLEELRPRWRVAGVYKAILEAEEVMSAVKMA